MLFGNGCLQNGTTKMNRVEWGKVGRFFEYFFNSLKNLDAMKDFMDYYGQCVSSLPLHKKIGPKKSCAGG